MSAQRWIPARYAGAGGQAFATRADGYQRKRRVYVCLACRAWNEGARPAECIDPHCSSGTFLRMDSVVEAQRFMALWLMQDAGTIVPGTLTHHPRYPLITLGPDGKPIAVRVYEADSTYVRAACGTRVVEDVKPRADQAQDPVFRLKRAWFEAQYGLPITIVS